MSKLKNDDPLSVTAIELQRIVDLTEASRLSSLSKDNLRRNHADKIRRLSPRRLGMRLADVLAISEQVN